MVNNSIGGGILRKIIGMIFCSVFFFHVTAFAEINKSCSDSYTSIGSLYRVFEINGQEVETPFVTNVEVIRWFSAIKSLEERYFRVWAPSNMDVNFNKKNTPYIEFLKDNQINVIELKKIDAIQNNMIYFKIKNDELKPVFNSDKVFVVMKTKNGEIQKFEIPNQIIKEWEEVFTTDLKKMRKENME